MKFLKTFFIFSIIFCCANVVWAADNWEFWPGNTLEFKINDKVSLKFIEEFRINDNMSRFYTYVLYAGTYVKVHKYIDIAAWYKFVNSKKHHHWEDSHRCDVDGILKYDLEGFKLSNRSRFEYNATKDSWLYRDRIKTARSVMIFDKKFTPYIFNEFFIHIGLDGGYHENRASAGISTDFPFGMKITAYYMSRAKKKHGNWKNANILGISLGMVF